MSRLLDVVLIQNLYVSCRWGIFLSADQVSGGKV